MAAKSLLDGKDNARYASGFLDPSEHYIVGPFTRCRSLTRFLLTRIYFVSHQCETPRIALPRWLTRLNRHSCPSLAHYRYAFRGSLTADPCQGRSKYFRTSCRLVCDFTSVCRLTRPEVRSPRYHVFGAVLSLLSAQSPVGSMEQLLALC